MTGRRVPDSMTNLLAGAAFAALTIGVAHAADLPLKAPPFERHLDWTGLYVGGHSGYGWGGFGPGTNPLPQQGVLFPHSVTGLIGGYQAGYNWQLSNRWVVGVDRKSVV